MKRVLDKICCYSIKHTLSIILSPPKKVIKCSTLLMERSFMERRLGKAKSDILTPDMELQGRKCKADHEQSCFDLIPIASQPQY